MDKKGINFYPIISSIQKMALYETKAVGIIYLNILIMYEYSML